MIEKQERPSVCSRKPINSKRLKIQNITIKENSVGALNGLKWAIMFLPWQKLCLHWMSTFLNNTYGIFPIKFYDKSWFITNLSIKNQLKFIKFCSSKYFFRRYLHWKFSGTLEIYEFHRAKLVISYDFTILSFFFFLFFRTRENMIHAKVLQQQKISVNISNVSSIFFFFFFWGNTSLS